MTERTFLKNAYLATDSAVVTAITDAGGVVLDQSIFYPTGGGQPGDCGFLEWEGGEMQVAVALKEELHDIVLVPAEGSELPPVGASVIQRLDWPTRNGYMRVHTALHLLSVVIPLPVTGGQISADKGRLDFLMPQAPDDREAIETALNALIEQDFDISESWITDEELAAKPEMVKTMSVKPPTGAGRVRLIRIGHEDKQIDLQPCGGTHVAKTAEIGKMRLGKIQNKGKQNRRVYIHLL